LVAMPTLSRFLWRFRNGSLILLFAPQQVCGFHIEGGGEGFESP
jgi:hypothetical protein